MKHNKKVSRKAYEELVETRQFKRYVQGFIRAVAPKRVKLMFDKRLGTAQTQGDLIQINPLSSLITFYESDEQKMGSMLGMVFHEIAHIRFLDFDKYKEAIDTIENGRMYGSVPSPTESEMIADLDELLEALQDRRKNRLLLHIYSNIFNIVTDPHDERKLMERFSRFVAKALEKTIFSIYATSPTLEKIETIDSTVGRIYALILLYARFGDVPMVEERDWDEDPNLAMLNRISYLIDMAKEEDQIEERFGYINEVVLRLWPFIREELPDPAPDQEDEENGQSPDLENEEDEDSNSKNNSEEESEEENSNEDQEDEDAINKLLETLENIGGMFNQPQIPEDRESSDEAKSLSAGESSVGDSSDDNDGDDNANDDQEEQDEQEFLNQIEKAISKMSGDIEKEAAKHAGGELILPDLGSTHEDKTCEILKPDEDKDRYEALYNTELKSYGKRLSNKLKLIFEDMSDSGKLRHRIYGKSIDAKSSYRVDERYFEKNKIPGDIPEIAIAVLVDQSGSMIGERIMNAQKAAILLQNVAENLNIPCGIWGHTTSCEGIILFEYTNFQSGSRKYALGNMEDRYSNRDGMAIKIVADNLSKRHEAIKLMFIISDGQPNDYGYSGEPAAEDIRGIIKEYKKKGIQFFPAAIGDDRDRIIDIYREHVLDIEDLTQLPKTMAKVLKKKISQI